MLLEIMLFEIDVVDTENQDLRIRVMAKKNLQNGFLLKNGSGIHGQVYKPAPKLRSFRSSGRNKRTVDVPMMALSNCAMRALTRVKKRLISINRRPNPFWRERDRIVWIHHHNENIAAEKKRQRQENKDA